MSSLPSPLSPDRHTTLVGRRHQPWVRRVVVIAFTVVVVLALANVMGQSARTTRVATATATLVVKAPERVRGGIFYQGRIEIAAHRRIRHPRLVLGPGWAEQQQINTIEPSPRDEASRDGLIELHYEPIEAGRRLIVWLQLEANPLGAGRRDQSVTLLDGDRVLARAQRRVVQFP